MNTSPDPEDDSESDPGAIAAFAVLAVLCAAAAAYTMLWSLGRHIVIAPFGFATCGVLVSLACWRMASKSPTPGSSPISAIMVVLSAFVNVPLMLLGFFLLSLFVIDNTFGVTRLQRATIKGDTEQVRAILSDSPPESYVNADVPDGHITWGSKSAISIAVLTDKPEIAELLLEHGANPNAYSCNAGCKLRGPAIIFAVQNNSSRMVSTLLRHGARAGARVDWANGKDTLQLALLVRSNLLSGNTHQRSIAAALDENDRIIGSLLQSDVGIRNDLKEVCGNEEELRRYFQASYARAAGDIAVMCRSVMADGSPESRRGQGFVGP